MRHKFMHVFCKFIACVMRILMWQTTSLCLKLDKFIIYTSPPSGDLCLVMKIFTFDSGRIK